MSVEHKIPPSLVEAFWSAIVAYVGWELAGGPEPKVPLGSQLYSIASIADFVSGHNDRMEDWIYTELSAVAPVQRHVLEMEGRTYAAGGRCLRGLYDALVKLRADL